MSDRAEYRRAVRQAMMDLTVQATADGDVPSLEQRLAGVTAAALALIRGAEHADVMLVEAGGQFQSLAPTSTVVGDLDAVQMLHQDGPCLQAAVADAVIRVPDLRVETRWPEFTAAALTAGVHSALTFQLFAHRHGTGALNIFSGTVGAFNAAEDEAIGAMLATHAAIILIASFTDALDLASTLASRDLIGQAKGILMERFVIDAATAFELMTAHARHTGATLDAVARDIVTST